MKSPRTADSTSNGSAQSIPTGLDTDINTQSESTGGHNSNEHDIPDSLITAVSRFLEDSIHIPSSSSISSPPVVSSSTPKSCDTLNNVSQPSIAMTLESASSSSLTPPSGVLNDLLFKELSAVEPNAVLPVLSDNGVATVAHDIADHDADSPKTSTSSRTSSNRTSGMLYGARRKRGSDGKLIQHMQHENEASKQDEDEVMSLHIADDTGLGGGRGVSGNSSQPIADDDAPNINRRNRRVIRKKAAVGQTKKRQPRKKRSVKLPRTRATESPAAIDIIVDHDLQQLYTTNQPRRTNRQRRPVKRESSPELTPSPTPTSSSQDPPPVAATSALSGVQRRARPSDTSVERTYPVSRAITDEEKQQIRAHIAAHPGDPPMVVARIFNIGRKQAWHMISRVLPDRPALRRRVSQHDIDRVRDIIANSPYLSYNNMAKKLNMAKSTFQHIARERLRKRARKTGGRKSVAAIAGEEEEKSVFIESEKEKSVAKEDETAQCSAASVRKRRSRVVKRREVTPAASIKSPAPGQSERELSPVKTRSKRRKLATLDDTNNGLLACYSVTQPPATTAKNKRKPRKKAVKCDDAQPAPDIVTNNESEVGVDDEGQVVDQPKTHEVLQEVPQNAAVEPMTDSAAEPPAETEKLNMIEAAVSNSKSVAEQAQQQPMEQSQSHADEQAAAQSLVAYQQQNVPSLPQQPQQVAAAPHFHHHQPYQHGWVMPTVAPQYHHYPYAAYTTNQPIIKQEYVPEYAVITADFNGAAHTNTVQLPPMPTMHPRFMAQFASSSSSSPGLLYSNHSYQQSAYHHHHQSNHTSIQGVQIMSRGGGNSLASLSPQPANNNGSGLIVCDRPLVPVAAPPGVNGRHVYMVADDAFSQQSSATSSSSVTKPVAVSATSTGVVSASSPSTTVNGGSGTMDGVSSSSSTSNTPSLMMPNNNNNDAGLTTNNNGEAVAGNGIMEIVATHGRQRSHTQQQQQRHNSGVLNNQFADPVGNINTFVHAADFNGNVQMFKTESYAEAFAGGNGGGYHVGSEMWPSIYHQSVHHQHQQAAYYAAPPMSSQQQPRSIPVIHVHHSGGALLSSPQPPQQLPPMTLQPRAINWSFLSALPVASSSPPQATNAPLNSTAAVLLSPPPTQATRTSPLSGTVSTTSQLNNQMRLSPQFNGANKTGPVQQHADHYEPASSVSASDFTTVAAAGGAVNSLPSMMMPYAAPRYHPQQQHAMPMVFMPNHHGAPVAAPGLVYEHRFFN